MEIYCNKKQDEIMDRKDAETKGRHIKEANKEKKSAGGNLLNYPYFHPSILFLHINIVYYYCC